MSNSKHEQCVRVGAPHIRSVLRNYRNGFPSNFSKGIKDFIDNIILTATHIDVELVWGSDGGGGSGRYIKKIIIRDDSEKGFENIEETGDANPLNFGHMRQGHGQDCEQSEFGAGMKIAAIRMSDKFEIYSRCIIGDETKYYHVTCDFDEMAGREDVQESYDPEFELIDEPKYVKHHKQTQGSTLILSDLLPEGRQNTQNKEDFEEKLRHKLSEAYSDFLGEGARVTLTLNGQEIGPHVLTKNNILLNSECEERLITFNGWLFVNGENRIEQCLVTRTHGNCTTKKIWDATKKDVTRYPRPDDFEKEKADLCEQSHLRCIEFQFYSVNIAYTSVEEKMKEDLGESGWHPYRQVRAVRGGRSYGLFSTDREHQSYSCQFHELTYESKTLNKLLGVTIDKEINPNAENREFRKIISALVKEKGYKNKNVDYKPLVCEEEKKMVQFLHDTPKPKKKRGRKSKKSVKKFVDASSGSDEHLSDVSPGSGPPPSPPTQKIIDELFSGDENIVIDTAEVEAEVVSDMGDSKSSSEQEAEGGAEGGVEVVSGAEGGVEVVSVDQQEMWRAETRSAIEALKLQVSKCPDGEDSALAFISDNLDF